MFPPLSLSLPFSIPSALLLYPSPPLSFFPHFSLSLLSLSPSLPFSSPPFPLLLPFRSDKESCVSLFSHSYGIHLPEGSGRRHLQHNSIYILHPLLSGLEWRRGEARRGEARRGEARRGWARRGGAGQNRLTGW
ncbi:hypothetical protein E2C01_091713 [Portunus trituberculatus]|uniref:Uncharacterized protein n=1 Tax=Portunus trituberculatus TaxID=210409 RepID=A0A5B7JVT5_PORTR|nr:hypothetical protein [Portunus trituberculatus]